jgi:arylsulfatase A-like enzyme
MQVARPLSQFDGRSHTNVVSKTDDTAAPRITRAIGDLLALAAWFGLVTGVAEAAISSALRQAGWPVRVSADILWVAPVVDLALFLIVGAALIPLIRPLRVRARLPLILVVFLWMLGFTVLEVLNLMRPWAGLMLSLGVAVEGGRRLPGWDHSVRLVRRTLVPLVTVAVVVGLTGFVWSPWRERTVRGRLPAPQPGVPNVLFITLDTLRADHVSAYGYARATTPNLDRFARKGVLFEHAFSNAPWTLPSHASMLTGRYPHEHGADWREPMDATVPTLVEAFAARGYATAAFAANTSYVAPEWGLGRGFSRFDVYGGSPADDVVRTALGRRLASNALPLVGFFDIPGRKPAAQLNDGFLTWLDGVEGRPFFAFLNFLDAHDPYLSPDRFHFRYSATPARGDVINFQFQTDAFRRKPVISPAEVQAEIDAYDGCLAYLDAELGRLLAELGRRGLDRNTLVVIASDHGESFGNHNLFGHGNSAYLETLHVPLVMVWPGHVPSDVRVSPSIGLERLPATIIELIDPRAGSGSFPGHSLVPTWAAADAAAQPMDPILSEVSHVTGGPSAYPTSGGSLTSLIAGEWHLVLSTNGGTELYSWPRDPQEQVNLADSPQGRVVVDAMKKTIQQMGAGRTP